MSASFESNLDTYRDLPSVAEQIVHTRSADSPDSSGSRKEHESDAREAPASPVNHALPEDLEPPEPEPLPTGSLRHKPERIAEGSDGSKAEASAAELEHQENDQPASAGFGENRDVEKDGETRAAQKTTKLASDLTLTEMSDGSYQQDFPPSRFPYEVYEMVYFSCRLRSQSLYEACHKGFC